MKKRNLSLRKETIRQLSYEEMEQNAGGVKLIFIRTRYTTVYVPPPTTQPAAACPALPNPGSVNICQV